MEMVPGRQFEVDGVRVSLTGRITRGSVNRGSTSGAASRGGAEPDAVAVAVARSGLRLAATLDLAVERAEVSRSRGAPAEVEPRIVLEPPKLGDGEVCHVALVEEDGDLHWEFAQPGTHRFELAVDGDPSTGRGLTGSLIRKAVRFLAVKGLQAVGKKGVRSLASVAEKRLRPTRLRTFTEQNYHRKADQAPELEELTRGPALLLIHGTNSRTDEAFGNCERQWVADLNRRYERRIVAFDHPSLSVSPAENARRLVELLFDGLDAGRYELDVLSHSRGGLVARELVQRIRHERIRVRSLVFVATPNNGTPLADASHLGELVDGLTNLAAVIPDNPVTDALEVVLELVKDVALDVAYDALEGVRCMAPTGAYLKALNDLDPPHQTTYRALAANFEPLSTHKFGFRLGNRLVDRAFGGSMNDLIVPTRSAYLRAGRFQVPADQRVVFDSSFGIHHCGYWTQPRVMSRLEDWLRPDWQDRPTAPVEPGTSDPNADVESALATADTDWLNQAASSLAKLPRQFMSVIESISGGPVSEPAAAADRLGAVVVLPGIMGSLLDVDGERVWVSAQKLHKGGFAQLGLDYRPGLDHGQKKPAIAVGLNKVYSELVIRLARHWDVFLFPFDWRRDIAESAKKLSEFIRDRVWAGNPRPVHLVAHSMGGLVARALAADPADSLWTDIDDPDNDHRAGGRLVMLGTPNHGSHAMALALLGEELLVKGLAAVDREHDKNDIAEIIATFPGTYQMLPAPQLDVDDDHDQLFSAAAWGSALVSSDLLRRARDFHQTLRPVVDPQRLVYVAGDGHQTPARVRIDHGKLHFGTHDRGDGRVIHRSGLLEGVDTYYCSSSHGDLLKDPDVLDALDDLLQTGETESLEKQPAARRGAAHEDGRSTPLEASQVDPDVTAWSRGGDPRGGGYPELEQSFAEATRDYLGFRSRDAARKPVLRVRVTHASLEQADHPVAVGHYRGIPPEGAEGFLDWRLDRLLSQHRNLGDYPETDAEILFVAAPGQRPPGGIVLGLGEFGGLTRSKLVRQIARAAIRRAMSAAEVGRGGGTRVSVGIAAVLVGTPGRYGLTVETSVAALVEGVARAIIQLSDSDMSRVRLDELQIVEFYEARATHAADATRQVRQLLPSRLRDRIDLRLPEVLESGRGGRPGMPSHNDSGDPWARIIVEKKDAVPYPELHFTSLGRSAQADRLTVPYNDRKIGSLIRAAVRDPAAIDEAGALYDLLFPHDSKLELDETDNLHLLVGEDSATIPWEILAGRTGRNRDDALALRTGMLRQLRPIRGGALVRSRSTKLVARHALVVGDPPVCALPRLPGARREAAQVAKQLAESGYEVERLVFSAEQTEDAWLQIQTALYRRPYRILHFATHGEVGEPRSTGLVIGDGEHLTALDFQQMSVTPDFVFLNACHVGRTGGSPGEAGLSAERVNELAANVALKLMENGVKAVIATGWAVDDRAALVFATRLYDLMLDGTPFGEAVKRARSAAHEADGGRTNTWGAYQCYGDPSFELNADRRASRQLRPSSAGEMIRRLEVLQQDAGNASQNKNLRWVFDRVKAMDERDLQRFSELPPVNHALAKVYAELGAYEDAVWAYRRATSGALNGELPLVVIEQLANMEVRLACQKKLKKFPPWPAVHPYKGDAVPARDSASRDAWLRAEVESLFNQARERLEKLIELEPTGERWALLGSHWKKRATTIRRSSRGTNLEKARDCYHEAWKLSSEGREEYNSYHTNLWVQMATLAAQRSQRLPAEVPYALVKLGIQSRKRLEDRQKPGAPPDFWADTAFADAAVSRALVFGEPLCAAEDGYRRAFDNRSTVRERDSVLDHLRDLVALLPTGAFDNRPTGRERDSVLDHLRDLVALLPTGEKQADIGLKKDIGDLRERLLS